MDTEHLVFIGGLGDTPSAWDQVVDNLHRTQGFGRIPPNRWTYTALSLADLCPLDHFTLDAAADTLYARIGNFSGSTHLVGLSAGAMVAMRYAANHEVHSLFLSAPQLKPSRIVIALQNVLFRCLPARLFTSSNVSKNDIIAVSTELGGADLVDNAQRISAPTTIACGSRDCVNLRATWQCQQLIKGSRLIIVDNAVHQWHTHTPTRFAEELMLHFDALRRGSF